jgi:3-phenylpropionate/trans-cinnamate dioxygenase ferredoxin subunit
MPGSPAPARPRRPDGSGPVVVRPVAIGCPGTIARVSRRIDLLAAADLAEGEMRMVWVDQTDPVLVVHLNGVFRALQGTCSHEYFELDRGFLTAGTLTCALHMSRFDLSDGEPLDPPAELPLAVYAVQVVDGRVQIEVAEGPLEVNAET